MLGKILFPSSALGPLLGNSVPDVSWPSKTGPHYIVLAELGLFMWSRLASNLQRSTCLIAGILHICHQYLVSGFFSPLLVECVQSLFPS